MQSAYFSYPRDFVGTTRQARAASIAREIRHADFRATLGKARANFTWIYAIPSAGRPRKFARACYSQSRRDPISPGDESFSELFARRLASPIPFVSLAFYRSPTAFLRSPLFSRLLPCLPLPPPPPLRPHRPRPACRLRKVFLRDPPALRFVPRFGALRKEMKGNGRMKMHRVKIRRSLGECEVSRRRGETGR